MTIEITIEGREKLASLHEKVLGRRAALGAAIKQELNVLSLALMRTAKSEFLSGPRPNVLDVVTGRLRRSITAKVREENTNQFVLSFGTNVVYGRIHEYGGQTGRKHAVTLRPRPFLGPTMEKEFPAFRDRLGPILKEALGGLTE